jgi:hypothetical protein
MRRYPIKLKQIRGTSLIEVLIALAITGVVTMAIFKAYITQHKQYLVQEEVSDIQQNVRASIEELSKHIRMAGHDLPLGVEPIMASNTNPDTITIVYFASGCETYLSDPMPQPSAELKCATDVTCFEDGDWVYIFEPDSSIGEWFEITWVQKGANHIQHNTMVLSRKYGANSQLFGMDMVKFFVDTADTAHPALMLQIGNKAPSVYAENITDLQFQYRMKNGMIVDHPVIAENIREVLISVTGRAAQPDRDLEGEPYRQRTVATSVNLRNNQI